jgi:hypothetical protein
MVTHSCRSSGNGNMQTCLITPMLWPPSGPESGPSSIKGTCQLIARLTLPLLCCLGLAPIWPNHFLLIEGLLCTAPARGPCFAGHGLQSSPQ